MSTNEFRIFILLPSASQELMLCYIIHPADLSDYELDSPDCLSRLKVQVDECVCVCVSVLYKP